MAIRMRNSEESHISSILKDYWKIPKRIEKSINLQQQTECRWQKTNDGQKDTSVNDQIKPPFNSQVSCMVFHLSPISSWGKSYDDGGTDKEITIEWLPLGCSIDKVIRGIHPRLEDEIPRWSKMASRQEQASALALVKGTIMTTYIIQNAAVPLCNVSGWRKI